MAASARTVKRKAEPADFKPPASAAAAVRNSATHIPQMDPKRPLQSKPISNDPYIRYLPVRVKENLAADELGGVHDEIDTLSIVNTAATRYVRNHEILETLVTNIVPTEKINPPEVVPKFDEKLLKEKSEEVRFAHLSPLQLWLGHRGLLTERAKALEAEVAGLEAKRESQENSGGTLGINDPVCNFYRRAIGVLEGKFGEITADSLTGNTEIGSKLYKEATEICGNEISTEFRRKFRRVTTNLGLPPPEKAPSDPAAYLKTAEPPAEESRAPGTEELTLSGSEFLPEDPGVDSLFPGEISAPTFFDDFTSGSGDPLNEIVDNSGVLGISEGNDAGQQETSGASDPMTFNTSENAGLQDGAMHDFEGFDLALNDQVFI